MSLDEARQAAEAKLAAAEQTAAKFAALAERGSSNPLMIEGYHQRVLIEQQVAARQRLILAHIDEQPAT